MIAWIMNFFPKKKKLEILDLACGDGKQTSLISKYLKLKKIPHTITACDVNKKLINIARNKNKNNKIKYSIFNFDKKSKFKKKFDLVICIFGIYYAKSFKNTLKEIKKILNKNSKVIFVGPLRNNKKDFHNIVEYASKLKIPKLIGSSRFDSSIFMESKKNFKNTKLHKMNNILKIDNLNDFMNYAKSSLSSKRGVYSELMKGKDYREIIRNVRDYAFKKIQKKKYLTISKKIGSIVINYKN